MPVTLKWGVDSSFALTPRALTWPSDLPPTASPQILSRGQTPFSIKRTFLPSIARYEAAAEPPGPPPTTMQSNSASDGGTSPVSMGMSQN